ncbi:hypothetical protein GGI15_000528 [Coemansia interrupta]|uniref:Uncharacterized protein n=1 Tax=Coemansia interrupta TaxID=1126814 RepID=A0A9W8HQV9_9FUNG|nr:hypothetical protein GGI15_000528 [Coemansia interrupta]
MVQMLAIHARDYGAGLAARLEVGRRAQEMVISIVENTVVWLFQVAFPAIGAFLTRCGDWTRQFIAWWIETGGPVARDMVEDVVLNYLVPTYHYLVEALGYGYQRTVWLGGRAIEAVYVLGMDLVHDVNAIGDMVRTFVQWVSNNERWWFNPAIWQSLIEFSLPGYCWLQRVYWVIVDQFIPWCVATLFSNVVFVPVISTLTVAIRFVWKKILEQSASIVYIWLVDSLYPLARQWSELLLVHIRVLFAWERIGVFLALGWQRTRQLAVMVYHAVSSSPVVAYLKTAMGDSVQVLQRWLGDLFVYLWPHAQRGWSDAAQAMYDVYRQLVSLVDDAVAMVGDYIVEFARSNAVHTSVSEQSPVLEKTKHALGKDE